MIDWIKNKIESTWQKFKDWSGWSTAGSIFLARMGAVAGFLTGVVGFMDWSPLWALLGTGTMLTTTQLICIGVSMIGTAVTAELTRRRNTKDF